MNIKQLRLALQRLFLIITAILVLTPLIYLVGISMKAPKQIFQNPINPLPIPVDFTSHRSVLGNRQIPQFFLNSVIFTSGVTFGQVSMAVLAAFGLSFYRFRGKNLLMPIFLLSMIVPFVITYVPNYLFLAYWKLLNSMIGMILPMLGVSLGFGIFLLFQHFQSFPREIHDAARIDGADDHSFLWRILVPSSMGHIASIAIYIAINTWNQYIWPLLVGGGESKSYIINVAVEILYNNTESGANWGSLMAASVLSSIPLLGMYFLLRKSILESFIQGAIKG